jgi:hypothetical protein
MAGVCLHASAFNPLIKSITAEQTSDGVSLVQVLALLLGVPYGYFGFGRFDGSVFATIFSKSRPRITACVCASHAFWNNHCQYSAQWRGPINGRAVTKLPVKNRFRVLGRMRPSVFGKTDLCLALRQLPGFGRQMFFLFHPFLKSTFQDAPLATDFECRNLPMLDHSMQCSLGNFQNRCGLGKSQQPDGSFGFVHNFGAPNFLELGASHMPVASFKNRICVGRTLSEFYAL